MILRKFDENISHKSNKLMITELYDYINKNCA